MNPHRYGPYLGVTLSVDQPGLAYLIRALEDRLTTTLLPVPERDRLLELRRQLKEHVEDTP